MKNRKFNSKNKILTLYDNNNKNKEDRTALQKILEAI